MAHIRNASKKGDELAKSWLARFAGGEDSEDPSQVATDDGSGVHSANGVIAQEPTMPPAFGG
jgi:hypothetical protein